MINLQHAKGKKFAMFGLGSSNIAAAKALLAGGAELFAFDDNQESCQKAQQQAIPIKDLHDLDWHEISALILTPGVALYYPKPHWAVELARAHDVEIIGDIELFLRERMFFLTHHALSDKACPFIAITGTNGKSTATALIGHLFAQAGLKTSVGGNIGVPILSLEPFEEGRSYIVECSSFQIDLTPSIKPTLGVLLNLTPDHIDRHKDFLTYQAVKAKLLLGAKQAVLAIDDAPTKALAQKLSLAHKDVTLVSTTEVLAKGYYSQDGELFYKANENSTAEALVNLKAISSLRGRHNQQNALAALAVLQLITGELPPQKAFESFQALPHRMQLIQKRGDIIFINDSKATNAEASSAALNSFDGIYWILGGVPKMEGIDPLRPFFGKIKKAYLIGEAAALFAQTIGESFPFTFASSLEEAVNCAYKDAKHSLDGKEAPILLSPACASYDQFPNYMARGEAFIRAVQSLS